MNFANMFKTSIAAILLVCSISAAPAFASGAVKEAGRSIGHATRDITREIGHTTRDTTKEIGHAFKNAGSDKKDNKKENDSEKK